MSHKRRRKHLRHYYPTPQMLAFGFLWTGGRSSYARLGWTHEDQRIRLHCRRRAFGYEVFHFVNSEWIFRIFRRWSGVVAYVTAVRLQACHADPS